MISIQTHTPKLLSPFIKSFWCLKVSEVLSEPYVEEILPDGHHEIIFHLNSLPIRKRSDGKEWVKDPAFFFTGQNRKSYTHQLNAGAIIYGIRFHPHTQALFYNFPASLSTDNLISLSDISVNDTLIHCISESAAETFIKFEKEFTRKACQLNNYGEAFHYVQAAVQAIIKQRGNIKIESLEKLTGVSSRYLEKSFQKFVGVSPKQLCNIVKYNHFITYRRNHPATTLTECAHQLEFHDQSHLIYLSKLITGKSPKTYFNKLNYINEFFLDH